MQSHARKVDPRTPVLVGVGTAALAAPVTELMTQAAVAAAQDAGAPGLLGKIERIAQPQGSWSLADPARTVAQRIGAERAATWRYELGVSQQEIVNDALEAIASGQADVVLVLGGEARAFERDAGPEADPGRPPDHTVTRQPDFVAPVELAAGIVWPPVQQYALIDTALAAHEDQDGPAHRAEVAGLWARFNEAARTNPLAAFPAPRSAADIETATVKNRPLAFPYNRWHASQWTVDQAAALLLCSAEQANAAGVPLDRWIFPHVALHSSHAITLCARRDLQAWPAMEVLGEAAARHLGHPLRDIELTEVYSCFPAAVRVQQRALGLDPGGTPTVTGGMTFAGGPFNNYVYQSTAAMVDLLRANPDRLGLVTTVCGMLSKPGLAVWSATPPLHGALVADLVEEATARTATVAVADPDAPDGPGCVVSYTVTYDEADVLQPVRAAIVAERPDGSRTAAACENAAIAGHAIAQGLIGQTVQLTGSTFTP